MHLKFNSGLNRIGLSEEELLAFIAALATLPFKLKSVYSHLGASENEQPCSFTQAQIEQFKQIKTKVENSSEDLPFFHFSALVALIIQRLNLMPFVQALVFTALPTAQNGIRS